MMDRSTTSAPPASLSWLPICLHRQPVAALDSPLQSAQFPIPGWVALLLLAFGAAWMTDLVLTSSSAPADNIAQLLWVQSLEWGYYKHPPLPTWLLRLPVAMFGRHVATSYLMAACMNLASMALLWRLLALLRGKAFATVGLLAALCVSYYNARFLVYNHNTVLMLVATASALLSWRACSTGLLRWWTALGLVLGLGLLTKYQIAITMVSILVFWLSQRLWTDVRQRRGVLIAGLVALCLFVPHLRWLQTHDFGPIGYAISTSLGAHLGPWARLGNAGNWLADQVCNRALPAWLMLIALAALRPRTGDRPATAPNDDPAIRTFLLIWGLLPLAQVSLIGLFAGSELVLAWGFPYLLFTVAAVMELAGSRRLWSTIPASLACSVFLIVQALLLTLSVLTSAHGPIALRDQHWRNFDGAALVRQLAAPLRETLAGAPVAVVSGPEGLAGALALQLPEHPAVLIDGRLDHSPWMTSEAQRRGVTLHIQRGTPLAGGTPMQGPFADIWWRVDKPARPPATATPPVTP